MSYNEAHIEAVLSDVREGKMVIVVDDERRENEGDLMIAAERVTPDLINFMSLHGRGLICLSLTAADFERLEIPMMTERNQSQYQTAFGVSIGAREGITTGISAADRAQTIAVAVDPNSRAEDLVRPGHVFPLRAKSWGVLARQGHTEACTDLARLAGLQSAAVLCEIMNPDGSMARMPDLERFAKTQGFKIISIADLVQYRSRKESWVELCATAALPMEGGTAWQVKVFRSLIDSVEITALIALSSEHRPPLVRLHSQCLTGDVFGSCRCDCGWQLKTSMARIQQEGGALLYLPQEGRGIGLVNKIKAYALQDQGMDTVEANEALGFLADERSYALAAQVLRQLGMPSIRLLTNNPHKQSQLVDAGISVFSTERLLAPANAHNLGYLKTKQNKLAHQLDLSEGF